MSPARYYSSTAVQTQLASGITAGAASFTVNAATGYPVSFPFTVILDLGTDSEEIVDVTAASGATFTVTRGVDGTTPVSHSVGANVVHGASARDHREAQAHISATGGVHGIDPASVVVGTTDTQSLTNKTLVSPTLTTPTINNATGTGGTYTNPTLVTPTVASFINAAHTHANAAGGGPIPESAVTGLTADLATLNASVGNAPVKANLPINVRDRGATGAGTVDDAGAIQSALDSAHTAGGGWVWIPAGTYKLATLPLRIYRNTRLTLDPNAVLQRAVAGTMIINGDAAQALGGYTGHGGLIIEGGTWDMRGASVSAYSVCMSIGHAENVTIRDLTIKDVPGFHGIELNSTHVGRVLNCRFIGLYQTGDRTFTEAVQLDLMKGSGYFGGFGPYDNTPCDDVLVQGCYFGPSGTANTTAWARGVGSHAATITRWHNNVRVIANHFDSLTSFAVQAYSWRRTVLANNTVSGCGGGLKLRVPDTSDPNDTLDTGGTQTSGSQDILNHVISGNVIENTGTAGEPINITGETTGYVRHAVVSGNTVDTTGGSNPGIRMGYAQESIIANNTIIGTGGTGISTSNLKFCAINDNIVITPGVNGITVDGQVVGDTVDIRGNLIRQAGQNGIHILGGTILHIQNNYVSGASRSANTTYYCFRISTAAASLLITGNRARKVGSGNDPINGLSITTGCTGVKRYGNDWQASGVTANLDDNSTTPGTTATDYT